MIVLAVVAGIFLAVALPVWGAGMLIVYCLICARETRRLKKSLQVDDYRWEHDLASLRRAAYTMRTGTKMRFLRPRRFYGHR